MDLHLSEIAQIAITVSSIEKIVPFYRDILGLKWLFSPSENLAFLMAGSVRIMLSTPEGPFKPGSNSILYFKVNDIVSAYAEIVNRGAKGEGEPHFLTKFGDHDLWLAFVCDPDGNLVGLTEEKQ